MKNRLKIYLAGKMSGLSFDEMFNWRNDLKGRLENIASWRETKVNIINPVDFYNFEYPQHQSEIEVEDFDLAHVKSSDVIIVNLDGLESSIGTIIELHDAHYNNKIPVIAFGNKKLYNKLHPWIKNSITRVEKNIDDIVEYMGDFYIL